MINQLTGLKNSCISVNIQFFELYIRKKECNLVYHGFGFIVIKCFFIILTEWNWFFAFILQRNYSEINPNF